jgi:hypothetical protein
MNTGSDSRLAVLTPDVLGAAAWDAECESILLHWRDGRLRPVVDRALLQRYLRVWSALLLPPRLLRFWGWWLTAPAKVELVDATAPEGLPDSELCARVAGTGQARWIVALRILSPEPPPARNGAAWVDARTLARMLETVDDSHSRRG